MGWKRPRRIFVNSLSDLFHTDVPDTWIADVYGVMMDARQHTFQVLTKRPERMRRVVPKIVAAGFYGAIADGHYPKHGSGSFTYPAENVHLGVSISTNDDAWRADMLRETPAAVRWISAEPLLGPLDQLDLTGIDWVVVGGESGPSARPMHPWWVRDLRDRCVAANVPFFFKQWGEWKPISAMADGEADALYHPAPTRDPEARRRCKVQTDVLQLDGSFRMDFPHGAMQVFRVGKRVAGRVFDGRTWDEYPGRHALAVPA